MRMALNLKALTTKSAEAHRVTAADGPPFAFLCAPVARALEVRNLT